MQAVRSSVRSVGIFLLPASSGTSVVVSESAGALSVAVGAAVAVVSGAVVAVGAAVAVVSGEVGAVGAAVAVASGAVGAAVAESPCSSAI